MTLDDAVDLLDVAAEALPARLSHVVGLVVDTAAGNTRNIIGHQQPEFAPLADATKAEKARLGFSPPDFAPLYRTGGYEESIQSEHEGLVGQSGSTWEGAVWLELGTPNAKHPIPARPAIALGMMQALPFAEAALLEVAVDILGIEEDVPSP